MNRGPGSLLAPEGSAAVEVPATVRRRCLRRMLAGFGDSCALVGVALLGCLALVAVGTAGSLAWMVLVDR
jgi:hypothetical protein